jgi:hypothetical protein
MAQVKTVRLVNSKTGVVVTTSEDVASRLSGFEAETKKAAAKKTADSK